MRYERRPSPSFHQSGYSLTELLVVVAIIGVMSLVAVPAFMTMMQSSRLKAGLRKFTTDLRSARQVAVTEYQWTKVDFETGTSPVVYFVSRSPDLGVTWGAAERRELEAPLTLASTTFTDGSDDGTLPEVIFRNNGTVANIPGGDISKAIVLKTPFDIPKPSITITVSTTGKITAN
ncbi:MAG TPA: prepilin-type N-terminal cleavage/methylation domain-containing protein [Thermoanaerobaculia bacterium]